MKPTTLIADSTTIEHGSTATEPASNGQARVGTGASGRARRGRPTSGARGAAALRDLEVLRSTLDEHSIVSVADRAGKIIDVNPAFCRISGYSREELLGQDHRIVNSGHHPKSFWVEVWRSISAGRAWRGDVCNRAKDGSTYWVQTIIAPFRDEHGRIERYVSIRTDITEQVRLGEAMKAAAGELERRLAQRTRELEDLNRERRLSDMSVNSCAVATLWVDSTGRIIRVNPAACELLGYSAAELIGEHHFRFRPDVAEADWPRLWERLRERHRLEFEAMVQRKDYRLIDCEFDLSLIDFDSSQYTFVFVRDISARKSLEARERELNRQLGGRLQDLADANRELEAFSYTVSHDLRAPLRHIDGFVGMLKADLGPGLPERPARHLSEIAGAAHDMGRLIDDLLAFSRTGRTEMRVEPVDLRQLVEEIARVHTAKHPDRRIEWRLAPLAPAMADVGLLRIAMVNLVSNALKYTRPRSPAIIEVDHVATELGRNVYRIRDNGVGFDMKYLSNLFGVFQRLHNNEEFEGTGIGLATVRRIIQRHGGRVWAEGEIGAGASFFFTLAPVVTGAPEVKP
ncbi:MAG: PAS domain S-box protein [Phycisphaerales bacterium]